VTTAFGSGLVISRVGGSGAVDVDVERIDVVEGLSAVVVDVIDEVGRVVEEVVVVDDVVVLAGGVSGNASIGSPGLQPTSITTSSASGNHLDAIRLTSSTTFPGAESAHKRPTARQRSG
jgi:hypothetical protein